MKKQILISLIIISSGLTVNAQWNGTNPVWTTSNVGIGTSSPTDLLQIGKYNTGTENNLALWTSGAGAGEQSKIKFKMLVSGGNSNSTIAEFVPHTYVNGGKNRLDIRVGNWDNNNNSGTSKMSILSNGFIGVGTDSPSDLLQIGKYNTGTENNLALWTNGAGAGEQSKIKFKMLVSGGNSNSTIAEFVPHTYVNDGKNRLDIRVGNWDNNNNSGTSKMSILSNGFIGVGTENPLYKLDVCGTIRANEVKVDLNGTCIPDFVFRKDYKLMNINELENFVLVKQHLPEIASEKEMSENGLNMKEFQMKLLQKIEELTLYAIQQNKKIEKLDQELKKMKSSKKIGTKK